MRGWKYGVLLCSLLLNLVALPAVAQDGGVVSPVADDPAIYLPIITGPESQEGPIATEEIMREGMINVDQEPDFGAPPKPEGPADALPEGPLPPPDPDFKDAQAEVAAIDGWTTILNDGFESVPWPFAGWTAYDTNGALNGNYYWDDDDFRPYRGGWSAWPANNALDPAFSNYAPMQRTWMIYGPFSLADAAKATLTFQYYNQSELNYDWLGWFASPNGSAFYGNWVSGDSGGWRPGVIDFQNVPGYGSMLGDASVWIGFYFYSDGSKQLKGPFIDDVFVQRFACPGQSTAFWYNSLSRNSFTQRAVTCENSQFSRNWGTGSQPWTSADNWSLEMTGKPWFATSKTYTFQTNNDDGVRVYVDGGLIIDSWVDQSAAVTHTGTVYLAAGYHTVRVEYYEHTGNAQLTVKWF